MFALIRKDLLMEARSKETLASLFLVGLLILFIFIISLDVERDAILDVAPGVLWASIVLASLLGLGRTFLIERENGCLAGLLIAPIDRGTIFAAKLVVNLLLLLAFEILLLPAFALFFGLDLFAAGPALALVLLAGSIGLAAAGTLFALAALNTRSRELMLPILVLPLEIPLLMACVRITDAILRAQPLAEVGRWTVYLVGFDVIFITAAWMLFEYLELDG